MDKRPKRRKSKDNPYTLLSDGELNIYIINFKDSRNINQNIYVTKEVFEAFDKFELEDISQMHKYDKYIEHSEVFEETMYKRAFKFEKSVEDIVEQKLKFNNLLNEINNLNDIQKRRFVMYYFYEMNIEDIAKIEGCTFQAISKSISLAIEKIRKNFKNNKN